MRVVIRLMLTLTCAVAALAGEPDPFIATWQLNWKKSKTSGEKPRIALRTYRQSEKGVSVSEIWVDQDGRELRVDYEADYDGKDHPVPNREGGTVAFTRPSVRMVEGVSKKNGVVEYSFKRIVSADGKTLTIEITRGGEAPRRLVYDRIR